MPFKMKESITAPGYSAVAVNFDVIEKSGVAALQPQWCVWGAFWRDDKQEKAGKRPIGINGRAISIQKPDEWMTFDEAKRLYEGGNHDGVGVLMSSVVGVIGLDLDDCLDDDGKPVKEKADIVEGFMRLGGYMEVSPSGKGLRQFIKGTLPIGYREKTDNGEIYDYRSTRYLTMTGAVWPEWKHEPGYVVENQKGLESFMAKFWEKRAAPKADQEGGGDFPVVKRSVEDVVRLLKQYNQQGRITRLLAGDTSDHDGDHSSADLDLCCQAAYFCRDPEVIDAVMRGSGLMRAKWDQMRGDEMYGQRTIRQAREKQERNFDQDQAERKQQADTAKAEKSKLKQLAADVMLTGIDDLLTPKGAIKQNPWALSELLVRDKRLLGAMHYDEFSNYIICNRPLCEVLDDKAAPGYVGRIDDDMLHAFGRWFGRQWGLSLKLDQVAAAVFAFAQNVRVNPVVDALNTLESRWDGKPRLNRWLIDYCRAAVGRDGEIAAYVEAVGSKFLIAAVARAFQPGCKVDTMLVLEGSQGAKKSTAARVIAEVVRGEYFREAFHLAGSKDDYIALRGRWIVEWGELSGMGRSDRNELKTFATKQCDPYRQPWDKLERDWPRSCVFICTTNDDQYLSDPTGNRRFWPVTVGQIDIAALRRDAPQILAEAVVRYKAGEKWWLDDADPRDLRLLRMAEKEQSKRMGSTFFGEIAADVAEALVCGRLTYTTKAGTIEEALPNDKFGRVQIMEWLTQYAAANDDHGGDKGQVLRIDDGNWNRVTAGLLEAGWQKTKSNTMVWHLRPDRLEVLCQLHGRDVGPKMPPLSVGAKRRKMGGLGGGGEGQGNDADDGVSQCEIPRDEREAKG